MFKKVSNVGIAVRDVEDALRLYDDLFGVQASEKRTVPEMGVKIALIPVGDFQLEFMEPLEGEKVLSKFLDARGEGVYKVAIEVDDMEAALRHLDEKGVPYAAFDVQLDSGLVKTAFLNPKATKGVMIEMTQAV
jgi:methylmalonyl-CoA epimerase